MINGNSSVDGFHLHVLWRERHLCHTIKYDPLSSQPKETTIQFISYCVQYEDWQTRRASKFLHFCRQFTLPLKIIACLLINSRKEKSITPKMLSIAEFSFDVQYYFYTNWIWPNKKKIFLRKKAKRGNIAT